MTIRSVRGCRPTRPTRDERGFIAGSDGLAFGFLIMVVGSLAFINIWAVVDTRMALDAASREFLRTYTEQPSESQARQLGEQVAREVLHERGTRARELRIEVDQPAGFGPCAPVIVRISSDSPWFKVPLLDDFGSTRVVVQNQELIDAGSEVSASVDYDPYATACHEG